MSTVHTTDRLVALPGLPGVRPLALRVRIAALRGWWLDYRTSEGLRYADDRIRLEAGLADHPGATYSRSERRIAQ